jgi:hypothetical protein
VAIPYLDALIKDNESANFQYEELEEVTKFTSMSKSGPGIGILLLVALPVGFYASKVAMSFAQSLQIKNTIWLTTFKASFVTVSKTFAVSLVQNNGNPLKALENVASMRIVKDIIFQVASDFLATSFSK